MSTERKKGCWREIDPDEQIEAALKDGLSEDRSGTDSNPRSQRTSNRTSEELRRRYEEIQRVVDPKMSGAERPDWATSSSESFVLLQASFQGRSNGSWWKKEEEDQLLNECRNRKMSWEQTAKKLQRTFGTVRTLGAIKARFEDHQ
jgi:hypothetical protein